MFEIGSSLAAARQGRALELSDVEALTCIRAKQLAALEHERFEELPGRAYARGFLRTYATCLGLDADLYVAEFEEQYPEDDPEPHVPRMLPPPRRPPRRLIVGVAVAVAAVVAIVVWGSGGSGRGRLPPDVRLPVTTARSVPAVHASPAPARKRASSARLVIVARRGRCWLLVRRGGDTGPVLYEGTLAQGSSVRFAAPHLWLRLGAPWNVDVRRGARVIAVPQLTGNVVA